MKAMIFAAGLGTRLGTHTSSRPKALVEVGNITLLEHLINNLKKQGIHEIIVNVHHFADQVIEFLRSRNYFDISIAISDERSDLLETGGGLMKAAWFFSEPEPFLVHNVDVFSDIHFDKMLEYHSQNKALATLAVSSRISHRYFLFDEQHQLCGWENKSSHDTKIVNSSSKKLKELAFSGIQIIDPAFFNLVKRTGKFSITDTYLDLAANHRILAYTHNADNWLDLGKTNDLPKADVLLRKLAE